MAWYKDGLKFECTRCGNCCTGSPGYVWITPLELHRIAEFLGINDIEFTSRYVRKVKDKTSLIELPNGNCIFYDKGCTIYPVRPTQCRTFPFWPEILRSAKTWQKEAEECPGMNKGPTISNEEIDALLKQQ